MEEIIIEGSSAISCETCPDEQGKVQFNLPEFWRRQEFLEPSVSIEVTDLRVQDFVSMNEQDIVLRTYAPNDPHYTYYTDTHTLSAKMYENEELFSAISNVFPQKLQFNLENLLISITNLQDQDVSLVIPRELAIKLGLTMETFQDFNVKNQKMNVFELHISANDSIQAKNSINSMRTMYQGYIILNSYLVTPPYFKNLDSDSLPFSFPVIAKFETVKMSEGEIRFKIQAGFSEMRFVFNKHPICCSIVDQNLNLFPGGGNTKFTLMLRLKKLSSKLNGNR